MPTNELVQSLELYLKTVEEKSTDNVPVTKKSTSTNSNSNQATGTNNQTILTNGKANKNGYTVIKQPNPQVVLAKSQANDTEQVSQFSSGNPQDTMQPNPKPIQDRFDMLLEEDIDTAAIQSSNVPFFLPVSSSENSLNVEEERNLHSYSNAAFTPAKVLKSDQEKDPLLLSMNSTSNNFEEMKVPMELSYSNSQVARQLRDNANADSKNHINSKSIVSNTSQSGNEKNSTAAASELLKDRLLHVQRQRKQQQLMSELDKFSDDEDLYRLKPSMVPPSHQTKSKLSTNDSISFTDECQRNHSSLARSTNNDGQQSLTRVYMNNETFQPQAQARRNIQRQSQPTQDDAIDQAKFSATLENENHYRSVDTRGQSVPDSQFSEKDSDLKGSVDFDEKEALVQELNSFKSLLASPTKSDSKLATQQTNELSCNIAAAAANIPTVDQNGRPAHLQTEIGSQTIKDHSSSASFETETFESLLEAACQSDLLPVITHVTKYNREESARALIFLLDKVYEQNSIQKGETLEETIRYLQEKISGEESPQDKELKELQKVQQTLKNKLEDCQAKLSRTELELQVIRAENSFWHHRNSTRGLYDTLKKRLEELEQRRTERQSRLKEQLKESDALVTNLQEKLSDKSMQIEHLYRDINKLIGEIEQLQDSQRRT